MDGLKWNCSAFRSCSPDMKGLFKTCLKGDCNTLHDEMLLEIGRQFLNGFCVMQCFVILIMVSHSTAQFQT